MRPRTHAGRIAASQIAVSVTLGVILVVARPAPLATATLVVVAGALAAAISVALTRRAKAVQNAASEAHHQRVNSQLEDAVQERLTRDAILSSMEEGVLLAAPDGTVTYVNPALERHLGSRPDALADLIPFSLRRAAEAAGGSVEATAVEVETGSPARWLRGAFVPVGDDGSLLLVVRDVTQARRLESVRRDFVTNASHELKTPVASIQAAAETIVNAAEDDPAAVPRFAERVERESVRLSRIVSDLLDLSRLESGPAGPEPVDLARVVREETERLAEASPAAEISVDAPPRLDVPGSERDLRLLVRNLAGNALRYTPEGGRVDVTLRAEGGEVVLRVADTGIGIPSRDLPRIFERFYRVDRARSRETGGTGLGLSIVKHVVENHAGTIEVQSELGRGTAFEVRLPAG